VVIGTGELAGLDVTSLQGKVACRRGSGLSPSPPQSVWSLTGTAVEALCGDLQEHEDDIEWFLNRKNDCLYADA